ncbi:ankyrin repeat domain-containing protein [Streptomyces sp. NPDC048606]|uniref:ankyrin repeat domain-containing protein n=1 Tax=Streptomyces sp. NPDC048606 TaxID=3154726 RepID=UPI0034144665
MIPLDPGLHQARRSLFRTDVDLYLRELPPPGNVRLVVEWPDEDVPETHTPVDAAALRAASGRVFEVWPVLERPAAGAVSGGFWIAERSGPPGFLAPAPTRDQRERLRRAEKARQRYVPRADWEGMSYGDWADADLVRTRLGSGAPPGAGVAPAGDGTVPLHLATQAGGTESVRALLSSGAEADVRDGEGHTPLWYAVHRMDETTIRTLIGADADVWTPQSGPWSPGRLLLTTPLAPLVRALPGAVELSPEEVAEQAEADTLIAAFADRSLWTEGLGIGFVKGVDEDELIRRLGADPAKCPPVDRDGSPPFDGSDHDEALHHVSVRGVDGSPGGCLITQDASMPRDGALLAAISRGTSAYGVYFNPKGGTFGTLAVDGAVVRSEEIGMLRVASDPAAYWRFRFWQRGRSFPAGAEALAYACAAAGLRVGGGPAVRGLRTPHRWVALPPHLRG